MKKVFLLLALLLFCKLPANTVSFRIALSDFAVHSKNPKYEHMGKGISEMIAVELAKSTDLTLIEREKRAEVLEEIEFALSDLADAAKHVEVGRMLAARYLVFGEIIDMDKDVLISLRMVDVESTKVVWTDQVATNIANYDYITGYFTESILEYLGLSIPRSTVAKVESIKEKDENAVVTFSKAVDAYDRKDSTVAREELVRARRIDPDNEAVHLYLSKLLVNLSKFKIEAAAMQLPSQNPAYLGFLQYAQVYLLGTWKDPAPTFKSGEEGYTYLDAYDLEYQSSYSHGFLGVSFPLGERFGIQTNLFVWRSGEDVRTELYGDYHAGGGPEDWGAQVNLGWAVTEWLSVGIGTSLFLEVFGGPDEEPSATRTVDSTQWRSAYCLGVLLKNRYSTVLFDLLSGFTFGRQALLHAQEFRDYLDGSPSPFPVGDTAVQPILLEGTLTLGLRDRSVFLVLRQTNNIYLDRAYYSGWLNPGAELWFTKWFAVRGALDLSFHKMEDVVDYGIGITGGITFRDTRRAWDLDVGSSYRMMPLRSLPGEVEYAPVVYINMAKNLLSMTR